MSSRTVDYGIDLGTTNSAIFRMSERGPEVIPVRQQTFMPSAVAASKSGALKIGTDALRPDFAPIALQFKRLMGGREEITLADGSRHSPQGLSAEVLKELRAAAKRRFDGQIEEVVIAVPAMFSQPQCTATHEAAELAGLRAVMLLQEPIAAATAFLSENPVDGNYLVYDLGGGTFDLSLIRLKDREMNVLAHAGDNFLGGVDFDRAIFEWALDHFVDRGVDVKTLTTGKGRHVLMTACENARLNLTDDEETLIDVEEMDLPLPNLELTRSTLKDIIEPFVTRTIEITHGLLTGKRSEEVELKRILLVGGPTQTPYVRTRLREAFGAALDFSQDPMTVVAKGAAIHASTLSRNSKPIQKVAEGTASLELFFESISADPVTDVTGRVSNLPGFQGEVRLTSQSGDFDTGWCSLVDCAFTLNVALGTEIVSLYHIRLRDLRGNELLCQPNSLIIRSGVKSAQPIASYNYGVVLKGGKDMRPLIEKSTPLPAKGFKSFRLARTLIAGSPDRIPIHFVEGASDSTEDNLEIGRFELSGQDIRRTLKEGDEIEIRVWMDASRLLSAEIYVPLLDEEWKVEMRIFEESPKAEELERAMSDVQNALKDIEVYADGEDEESRVLQASRRLEELGLIVDRVRHNEIGAAAHAQSKLASVRDTVRPLIESYLAKARHTQLLGLIKQSEGLCQRFDDKLGLAKLADYEKEAEKSLSERNIDEINLIENRASKVFWEHYIKIRECWENQARWMRACIPSASEPVVYYELVRRAEEALEREDYEGVRIHVIRAFDYLPEREKANQRFFDAGVV